VGEWEREAIQAVSTSVFPFCQVRAAATATATADGGGGWDKIRARVSSFLHFLFSFITGELAVEVSQQGSFLCRSFMPFATTSNRSDQH